MSLQDIDDRIPRIWLESKVMRSKAPARAVLACTVILVWAAFTSAASAECGGPGRLRCAEVVGEQRRSTNTPFPSDTAIAVRPLQTPGGSGIAPAASPELHQLLQTAGAETQIAQTPSPTATQTSTPTSPPITPEPSQATDATPIAPASTELSSTAMIIGVGAVLAILVSVSLILRGISARGNSRRNRTERDE